MSELTPKIFPEVGWLAPNGDYFPANAGDSSTMNYRLHLEIGEAIIEKYFPEMVARPSDGIPGQFEMVAPYDESHFTSVYDFLFAKGYLKVDLKMISGTAEITTREQVNTMFDLYNHPASGHYADLKEGLRRELIVNGLTFLSKPGDPYYG